MTDRPKKPQGVYPTNKEWRLWQRAERYRRPPPSWLWRRKIRRKMGWDVKA